ncbi:MAG: hypothetical protein AAFY76_23995 [Cyanobacteria bacterium J06649_11]
MPGKSEKNLNEILRQHVKAMGGEELLNGIKTIESRMISNGIEFSTSIIVGTGIRQDVKTRDSRVITTYVNDNISRCENGKRVDVDVEEKRNYKEDMFVFKLFKADERGWGFKLVKTDKSENFYEIEGVNEKNQQRMTYKLDKTTFLLRELLNEHGQIIEYVEYRQSFGLMYPLRFKVRSKDYEVEYLVEELTLNGKMDIRDFAKTEC